MATSFTLLKSTFCWVATFLKKMSVPIPLFYRHVWLLKPSHVLCKTFCSLQFLLLGLRRWEVVCSPTLPPPPPTPLFPPFSPLWHVLTTKAGGFGWDFTFLVSVTISHRWPVVHCPFSCSLSLLRSPWQALKCPLSHGAHLLSFRGHSVTSPCQVPPPEKKSAEALRFLSLAPCPHPPKWVTPSISFCGLNTLSQKDSYMLLPRWCLLQPKLHLKSPFDPRELPYLLVKFNHEEAHWPHPNPELVHTSAISPLLHFLTSNGTHSEGLGFRSLPTFREQTITHSSMWREDQSELSVSQALEGTNQMLSLPQGKERGKIPCGKFCIPPNQLLSHSPDYTFSLCNSIFKNILTLILFGYVMCGMLVP